MRGIPHRCLNMSIERSTRNSFRLLPGGRVRTPVERAIAGETELADGSVDALIDDTADRFWESRVHHPVQHHLGHCLTPGQRLERGFMIHRLGQAFQRRRHHPGVHAKQLERLCRYYRFLGKRDSGVANDCVRRRKRSRQTGGVGEPYHQLVFLFQNWRRRGYFSKMLVFRSGNGKQPRPDHFRGQQRYQDDNGC